MNLVVGLGNHGERYVGTRHNAGFLLIDKLKFSGNFVAKKSDEFMNNSGVFAKKLVNHYSLDINHLYIAHDDLDIKLGSYKIQFAKGPKDHKGLLSIYNSLGTKNFWHVRIGVENRSLSDKISGEEYVLQKFTNEEEKIIDKLLPKTAGDLYERFQ